MNTTKYNKFVIFAFIASVTMFNFTSCKDVQIEVFEGKPALYFPLKDGDKMGIDSAYVSFSHYPGQDDKDVSFKISLIGDLLEKDTEYRVVVIDSLTTANPDEYTIPEVLKFKNGVADDTFTITIHRKPRLSETDVKLVVMITENENFDVGFYNQKMVKVRFDNLKIKPLWWTKEIDDIYMGAYSVEKLDIFYIVSKLISIEGLAPSQLRDICLKMAKYISDNNIPNMEIPIY